VLKIEMIIESGLQEIENFEFSSLPALC